ncbi:MAG: tRNA (adenosine(37)-N6)-dimethylallyltransferase MiaA [Chloroherpetonaceae bacterium]|nr:tRNA (adenosine(37)-N6)-dimethylallyltransferase MiaA [Chloroherpetonaceae bacterium]
MTQQLEYKHQLKIPVLLGPTASGKTDLAYHLAVEFGGEVISADSRQIYRELTIGSGKPSNEMLKTITHHFINERTLPEPYDAATFAQEAWERIQDCIQRGKIPIVAGGSTLYLKALINGFSEFPKPDLELREKLQRRLASSSLASLYEELKEKDPQRAASIDPSNPHRVIRSLEVVIQTGTSFSELAKKKFFISPYGFDVYLLSLVRSELYRKIDLRIDEMLENGFEAEAKKIFDQFGYESSISALETVGYKEFFSFFREAFSKEEAVMLMKQHTRNYAKRQETYFRNQFEFTRIDAAQPISERMLAVTKVSSIFSTGSLTKLSNFSVSN